MTMIYQIKLNFFYIASLMPKIVTQSFSFFPDDFSSWQGRMGEGTVPQTANIPPTREVPRSRNLRGKLTKDRKFVNMECLRPDPSSKFSLLIIFPMPCSQFFKHVKTFRNRQLIKFGLLSNFPTIFYRKTKICSIIEKIF